MRFIPSSLHLRQFTLVLFTLLFQAAGMRAQSNEDCLMCHDDKNLKGIKNGRTISVYVNSRTFSKSVHSEVACIDCHQDIDINNLPHRKVIKPVECGICHSEVQELYVECLHGKANARGDPLAPTCQRCHGSHDILNVDNPESKVAPMKIPFLCGSCHREGSPVQLQRDIPQDRILENYSQSIHGEGLLKKGLIVSATCVSCHTPHRILPHTDPRSSISRNNIAKTCSVCHAEIEQVHVKIIKGELWEKQPHVLPACVDCHQPHRIRNVYYELGASDKDCLDCHQKQDIVSSKDGRSLHININILKSSVHNKTACSQCHSQIDPTKHRPCETITLKVDCSACHAEIGSQYLRSIHGRLSLANDENVPDCKECHGTHNVIDKLNPVSPVFATNIPRLCAKCHREGEKAAVRYTGTERDIIEHYVESIHGKGLLESGLTVTAKCTDCHTAHLELPHTDPLSSVNPVNIAKTCGNCHHGIQEQFQKSIHSPDVTTTDKKLPVCSTCHSAHTITRTDEEGFKLEIMGQCGNCHKEIAETYFDTYHGKVSELGYTKTAKCYDCHGSHDILPVSNPASHLSRDNVVETCQKCHEGANRQFAGYFTHATHHDPDKYPILFWTFWGMTGLLVFTFIIAGLHTLLWLPRSLQWKRELRRRSMKNAINEFENNEQKNESDNNTEEANDK